MKQKLTSICLVALTATLIGCNGLQGQNEQEEKEKVELKVGDTAADFTLKDQDGNEHKMSELVGERKLAIVFVRSVNW